MTDPFSDARPPTPLRVGVAAFVVALAVGMLAALVADALTSGLSGADEPAHFLNGYVIARYATDALGSNPMGFVEGFYVHYPKISLGHWPPAFYAAFSPLFLVLPATPATAFMVNLLLCAIPPVLVALVLLPMHGRAAALGGAGLAAATPVALEGNAFFMLDAVTSGLCLAATMLWIAYADRATWPRIVGFALLAATAILVKGNGWLVPLVPAFHIALTGRWHLLASLKPYAAATLALLLVGPWYWLTAGISGDGFNYEAGLAYAGQALVANVGSLLVNLTPLAPILAAVAVRNAWAGRRADPARWSVVGGCLALIGATLALQSIVPVDIVDRYMAPALLPLAVLAVAGLCDLKPRILLAVAAAAILVMPGAAHLAARTPKVDFRLDEVARDHVSAGQAWVVDGSSGAEGSFIVETAIRDPGLTGYAVRASQMLSGSDFMGRGYALKTRDPAAVLAELKRLGIGGVALVRIDGRAAYPHGDLLRRALTAPGSGFVRVAAFSHGNRPGITEVFRTTTSRPANAAALDALGTPAKAKALTGG